MEHVVLLRTAHLLELFLKPGHFLQSVLTFHSIQLFLHRQVRAIAGWMSSANPSLQHAAVAQGPPAAFLKHLRTPTSAPGGAATLVPICFWIGLARNSSDRSHSSNYKSAIWDCDCWNC